MLLENGTGPLNSSSTHGVTHHRTHLAVTYFLEPGSPLSIVLFPVQPFITIHDLIVSVKVYFTHLLALSLLQ